MHTVSVHFYILKRYCAKYLAKIFENLRGKLQRPSLQGLCLRIFVRSFKDIRLRMLASRKYEEMFKKDHWWSRYMEAAQKRFKGVLPYCII